MSSVEGSDLASGLPQLTVARDPKHTRTSLGRLLTSADVSTTNVVGGQELTIAPFNLRPGDTITLADPRTHEQRTLTMVGFYPRSLASLRCSSAAVRSAS